MAYPSRVPPTIPPAVELDQFLQALRRSRLLARNQIDVLLSEAPQQARGSATALGEWFVSQGSLTHFQVVKLTQGTHQGLVLGPYQILSPLGRGGMGTVYLARDTRSEPERNHSPVLVALKVLAAKRAREEERTLARFLREMELARVVDHPHVTKTFETGTVDGVHFIAMEYIRGVSLRRQITDRGPLAVPRAARFFSEVCDGLQNAHLKGLIHRDLKPSNMMVTPNGHAKILDMGLAFLADEELPADIKIVGGEGYVVGTMDYIAPEQIDNPTAIDGRADLYALGCSMYMALTGRPPFPGGTSIEKMRRHRNAHADPITDHNPTVPADFARIVGRLMEKNPADRYASARHVRKALAPWIAGDPETPLDTDPHQTEAQVLEEIEQAQPDPGSFFESIPVGIFTDRNRKGTPPASPEPKPIAEDGPPPVPLGFRIRRRADRLSGGLTEEFPGWLLALAGFVAFMLPVLVFVIILRALFR